jgi:hypothetical protein
MQPGITNITHIQTHKRNGIVEMIINLNSRSFVAVIRLASFSILLLCFLAGPIGGQDG